VAAQADHICTGSSVGFQPFRYPDTWLEGEYYWIDLPLYWNFRDYCRPALTGNWRSFFEIDIYIRVDWALGGSWELKQIHYPYDIYAQQGSVVIENFPLPPLPLGPHTIDLQAKFFCTYGDGSAFIGEHASEVTTLEVEVVEAFPLCSFTVSTTVGYAPLYVEFTDTSIAPAAAPITSWHWDFGDGATSSLQNPYHVYETPGTYTVTLTVSNQHGSDSASVTINVLAAAPHPVFSDRCWFPTSVRVDQAFTPVLIIENQGGSGDIYIDLIVEGRTTRIFEGAIDGYAEYQVDIGSHTIDWYLGYTPTESRYATLRFQTGPVGEPPIGDASFTISVLVEGPPPPPPPPEEGMPWWVYAIAGGGALIGIGGLVLALRRKKWQQR